MCIYTYTKHLFITINVYNYFKSVMSTASLSKNLLQSAKEWALWSHPHAAFLFSNHSWWIGQTLAKLDQLDFFFQVIVLGIRTLEDLPELIFKLWGEHREIKLQKEKNETNGEESAAGLVVCTGLSHLNSTNGSDESWMEVG